MTCKVVYFQLSVLHGGSGHVNIQAGQKSECIKSRVFIDEWAKEPPQLNCTVTGYHLREGMPDLKIMDLSSLFTLSFHINICTSCNPQS